MAATNFLMYPEAVGVMQDSPDRTFAGLVGLWAHKGNLFQKLYDAMDPAEARFIAETYPAQFRAEMLKNGLSLRSLVAAQEDWRDVLSMTRYTLPARLLATQPAKVMGLPLLELYAERMADIFNELRQNVREGIMSNTGGYGELGLIKSHFYQQLEELRHNLAEGRRGSILSQYHQYEPSIVNECVLTLLPEIVLAEDAIRTTTTTNDRGDGLGLVLFKYMAGLAPFDASRSHVLWWFVACALAPRYGSSYSAEALPRSRNSLWC